MKIIIPTDFSENAYKAVSFVYENFKYDSLEISLIHSIKQPASGSGIMLRLDDLMMEDAKRDMKTLLAKIKEDYDRTPEVIIRYGYLKEWVEQVTKVTAPDLIVMGTKGENNITSKLMGSVTESIIRTSKVPVLAIPSSTVLKPIGVVTVSTASDELHKAQFLENFLSSINIEFGRFEVLRVLTDYNTVAPRSIPLGSREVPVETVRNKSVVDGINDYISKDKTDMLCVYHSHNSMLDYLFNRSVTKTICAHVELPLLVMRGN